MKEVMENLRRYLQFWDPIGVIPDLIANGLAPSEYDGYAGPIYTLLASGVSVEDLYKHLSKIRTDYMGMKLDEIADQAMANSLHKYFNTQTGFRK